MRAKAPGGSPSPSSSISIDDKEPRPGFGARTVRRSAVSDLIRGARGQPHDAAIRQLGVENAVEHVEDVSLLAPVIGEIARRIFDDAHTDAAEFAGAPARL